MKNAIKIIVSIGLVLAMFSFAWNSLGNFICGSELGRIDNFVFSLLSLISAILITKDKKIGWYILLLLVILVILKTGLSTNLPRVYEQLYPQPSSC